MIRFRSGESVVVDLEYAEVCHKFDCSTGGLEVFTRPASFEDEGGPVAINPLAVETVMPNG